MIPDRNQIDTDQVAKGIVPVESGQPKATDRERVSLRPELRKAFEDSWKRNEAAYRYLGR
jgi:hypothetical protein